MAQHLNHIVFDQTAYASDPNDPDARFAFDDIIGKLQPKQKQLEVHRRPGLPGETLRNLGVWAEPSILFTLHGVLNRAAALDAIDDYQATLMTGEPFELIHHSESMGFIRVRKITPLPLEPLVAHAGWLISNATICQRIAWEVISTIAPAP